MRILLLVVSTGVLAAACSRAQATPNDNSVACTMEARAGITVTVLDSAARQAPSVGAVVVARAGTYADTAQNPLRNRNNIYSLVWERPGTYDVTVNAAGYRPWVATGITVSKTTCHVSTVELTAQLQR
jgi:hypothetical protein